MTFSGLTMGSALIVPITLIAFLILLSVIVFIHEFGHFSVARLLGVKVDVFSIGFGKTLAKWRDPWGTEWRIAALPLGGYVKFFGDANAASTGPEEGGGPATTQFGGAGAALTEEEKRVCFHYKPVWARALIVAAGPVYNFLLAIAIFTFLFMALGRSFYEPLIGDVSADSAAAEAGLAPGDEIVSVDGRRIEAFNALYDIVLLSGGEPLRFEVERAGERLLIDVAPRRVEREDRYGNPVEIWQLGVAPDADAIEFKTYGFIPAMREGVLELRRILSMTVNFLGKIILGREDARQLGGPIKMAQYAGQSAMSGFDESAYRSDPGFGVKLRASLIDFVSLAAVVSVSIGFLNLLPVPVLDGGHLLYYAYEAIAGKPLGPRAQAIGFRVGLVALASFMIFVTWNDINNLISSIS